MLSYNAITILYYTILYYTILYNAIQYNTVKTLQYNTKQYIATGESFVTSSFTFCFINIHFQVEKEIR